MGPRPGRARLRAPRAERRRAAHDCAYHLQAAIAAVHAGAATPDETRWREILALYDRSDGAPAVAHRRAQPGGGAVARGGPARRARGNRAARDEPALANYYLLPSVKGRLLAELGDHGAAADCYRNALERPCSEPERRFLLRRLQQCAEMPSSNRSNDGDLTDNPAPCAVTIAVIVLPVAGPCQRRRRAGNGRPCDGRTDSPRGPRQFAASTPRSAHLVDDIGPRLTAHARVQDGGGLVASISSRKWGLRDARLEIVGVRPRVAARSVHARDDRASIHAAHRLSGGHGRRRCPARSIGDADLRRRQDAPRNSRR